HVWVTFWPSPNVAWERGKQGAWFWGRGRHHVGTTFWTWPKREGGLVELGWARLGGEYVMFQPRFGMAKTWPRRRVGNSHVWLT
ncbi:hypothetical protein PIB30_101529, partial [Stylosanthes scabra]|nr:hypothetical protein [Stylosanthes scabra]